MQHLFPKVVSYNRFIELQKDVAIPLALFIKKGLLGKCTGIGFVDSTPLEYKEFINLIYGKLVGDKGYIGKGLFKKLFVDGIQFITKLKSTMKGALMSVAGIFDVLCGRKEGLSVMFFCYTTLLKRKFPSFYVISRFY